MIAVVTHRVSGSVRTCSSLSQACDELKRTTVDWSRHGRNYRNRSSTRASVNGIVVWSDCVVRQLADTLNSMFNWHVKCRFCVPVLLLWACFVRLFGVIKEQTITIHHLLRLLSFTRWRHFIFQSWFKINYELMLRIKWLWLIPDLMQILSIFLKLQAVKQSGPGFLAYPVHTRHYRLATSTYYSLTSIGENVGIGDRRWFSKSIDFDISESLSMCC